MKGNSYTAGKTARAISPRFWSKVDKRGPDECWPWLGGSRDGRYGHFFDSAKKKNVPAHRFSWELHNGKAMPSFLKACHSCNNTKCVNYNHVYPDTQQGNLQYAVKSGNHHNANKMVCSSGHPLVGANVYYWKGQRSCKICRRMAKWRAR